MSKTQAELIALFNKSQTEGPSKTVSEMSVANFLDLDNSAVLKEVVIPYGESPVISRGLGRTAAAGTVPCYPTHISYRYSLVKSQAQESFGELIDGVSADIYGYDVERDAQNAPIYDEVPDPLDETKTIKVPKLIDKDEAGNPIEPKRLMHWIPQWGVNRSKPVSGRVKGLNMLNLVPGDGVPRKRPDETNIDPTKPKDPTARPTYDRVAFEEIPGMEAQIQKPLVNAKILGLTDLLEIVEHIPVASNAPSRKAEQQQPGAWQSAGTKAATQVAAGSGKGDPFAKGQPSG